jgi:hypothetical protein
LYYISTGYQPVLLAVGELLAVRRSQATWTLYMLAANDWFARQSSDKQRIRHSSLWREERKIRGSIRQDQKSPPSKPRTSLRLLNPNLKLNLNLNPALVPAPIPDDQQRKFKSADRCRFIDITRGSALECAACLDAVVAKTMMEASTAIERKRMLIEIVSMSVGLICSNSTTREV